MLHSNTLVKYEGELNPAVVEAIFEIKKYFKKEDLQVYEWDKYNIVVAAQFEISLPTRGSIDNLILSIEPVLVKISLAKYPERAPRIMSDRKNFPKNRLPHLYYTSENEPAALCLVRDNLNQWFATITIRDLLHVGAEWFYKAATGTLLNDNNEFDPLRFDNNETLGKHIFKYEMLRDIVKNNERFVPNFPMSLMLSCAYTSQGTGRTRFKSISAIPFVALGTIKDIVKKAFRVIVSTETDIKVLPLHSFLVWDPQLSEENHYSTKLPTNYWELKEYLILRGIDIDSIIQSIEKVKLKLMFYIPVIHAIKRPFKLIGYEGDYEFITYLIDLPEDDVKGLTDETKVYISQHSEPFSSDLASVLSNEKRERKTLFIGAGSLGSKILMHDARIGKKTIGVVDNDDFEQHNLGRHALYSNKIGKNKAEAIIEEVKAFYELDNTDELVFYNNVLSEVDDTEIEKYQLLLDSTASQQVLQYLTLKKLNQNSIYSKCELVDKGEIGLLYIEGNQRNPRMDDLVNFACYLAAQNPELEKWRRSDANRTPDTLNIGLGCNSVTTVMPDDLISFHASIFSQILASKQIDQLDREGLVYLSISRKISEIPEISSECITVKPFEVFECNNNSGWSLRLLSGLSNRLLKLCNSHGQSETGGVLVGVANYKTKVIHVFDVIEEPVDSNGSPVAFTRGIRGLPEKIDKIKAQTGEVVGYIGEWHTHPMNLEKLSHTDLETIEKLKIINGRTPIPTCAVIVTQNKIIPFVYDSEE